jgi:hypothetical protein
VKLGIDLEVTATTRGYAENLVVRNAAAAQALTDVSFGLFSRNTTVSVNDGAMLVKDSTGKVLFAGDASSMWDSSGVGTEAERNLGPGGGDRHAKMTVYATANTVTLTPDHAFLTDPATKFPVVLDPDTSCNTCVSQAHVVVQSGFPNAPNYNQSTQDLSNLKAGYETQDAAAVSRSYFQVNTTQLAGAKIHNATVNTKLLHSTACAGAGNGPNGSTGSAADDTGLWLSNVIGPSTTWNNQPGLVTAISATNRTNCGDAPNVDMQFDAAGAAQYVADRDAPTVTLMLGSTTDVYNGQRLLSSWRRFALDPVLQVNYNKWPSIPGNLKTQFTLPCVQGAGRPWVATRNPEIQGYAFDPDGGNVTESFQVDAGTVGNIVPNTRHSAGVTVGSGSTAQLTLPDGWIPSDGNYTWVTSDFDGELWSHDSQACEFTVDSVAPPSPKVFMTGTPPSMQGEPATFTVSVGLATAGLYDIDHFIYTTDGSEPDPQTSPTAAAQPNADNSAAGATLTVTALNSLQNYIHVRAVNRAGTPSLHDATCIASLTLDASSCSYSVPDSLTPATGLVGAWGFDEMTGRTISDSVAATPGNAGVPAHPATLIGGGDWRPGHDHGTPWTHPDTSGYAQSTSGSLTLDGTSGYVKAGAPVIDTSQSFTASAWVYLVQTGVTRAAMTVGDGTGSSFNLQYNKELDNWTFSLPSDQSGNPTFYRATATTPLQLNVWTHLVGTYDASTGAIKLYVDGVPQRPATGKAWRSNGFLTIGAAGGGITDFFPGLIDSPQVWQRALSAQEVRDLAQTAAPLAQYNLGEACGPDLNSKTSKVISQAAYWPMDEGSGATANDVGRYADKAILTGGYTWTDGHAGGKAAHFDGSSATAATQYSVVDTSRSFTVSAWAKVDDLKGYYTVVAQHGSLQDAFQIRYSFDVNRWVFGMTTSDSATEDYQWALSDQVAQPGQWTLVTGVFDRASMEIRIYLNGKRQAARSVSSVWQAVGSTYIGSMSGHTAYFKGAIGQVQLWNQALTDDQVAALGDVRYYDGISHGQGAASGGISLVDDADGCSGQIDTTNTGNVQGTRPGNLRTDRSYTVEAWVKHTWTAAQAQALGAVDPYARTAVSTSDAPYLPFALGYRSVNDANGAPHGKWSFMVSSSPNQAGGWIQISDQDAADNRWTHIVGVYDAFAHIATLYVDGVRQNVSTPGGVSTDVVTGWNGSGGVSLGQDHWQGNTGDPWYGGLAGVRLYSGVLTTAEISKDKRVDDPGLLYGIEH